LHGIPIPKIWEFQPEVYKLCFFSSSSSLACGLAYPAFIGDDRRIELSYSINFFCGRSAHQKRAMEGEVSWKEVKDTVLVLAKQMGELKAEERNCLLQAALKIHQGVFQAQRSSVELEES